jgi:hypothetical protein
MIIPPKAFRGYVVCVGICGLAYAFTTLDALFPFSITRAILCLAVIGVGITTFRWAGTIGYPARDREGHVQVEHVFRTLAMTGVMTFVVIFASLPFFFAVSAWVHK